MQFPKHKYWWPKFPHTYSLYSPTSKSAFKIERSKLDLKVGRVFRSLLFLFSFSSLVNFGYRHLRFYGTEICFPPFSYCRKYQWKVDLNVVWFLFTKVFCFLLSKFWSVYEILVNSLLLFYLPSYIVPTLYEQKGRYFVYSMYHHYDTRVWVISRYFLF